jgi:CheY-like chemotaxis protein
MSMPRKSGVSTYRDLKGDPALWDIPVLIITGIDKAFEGFIHKRRKVPDPEGFLAKPIDLETLETTVRQLLGAPGQPAAARHASAKETP